MRLSISMKESYKSHVYGFGYEVTSRCKVCYPAKEVVNFLVWAGVITRSCFLKLLSLTKLNIHNFPTVIVRKEFFFVSVS